MTITVRRLIACGVVAGITAFALPVSPQTSVPAVPPRTTVDTIGTRIDEYIAPYVATKAFSGSILISHHGAVPIARGYGVSDLEHATVPSIATRFGIGSVTKTF